MEGVKDMQRIGADARTPRCEILQSILRGSRYIKSMMRFSLLLVLALLLSACAPSAEEGRVEIAQLAGEPSFYPRETGATWTYLPAGASLGALPVFQQVEGPTLIGGERWIAWRLAGRGLDVRTFKQYRPEGVFVLRELRPGTQLTFDPPLQELPAQSALRVGASWGGESTANIYYSDAPPESQRDTLRFTYTYSVVDKRQVRVEAGAFDVFVINLESQLRGAEDETDTQTVRQEIWFAPFVGEVRTELDLVLTDANFGLAQAQ